MHQNTNLRLTQTAAPTYRPWERQTVSASGGAAQYTGSLATGFTKLDALLGGGIPCGRITTITGQTTSGRRSLALHALASAQRNRQLTAYLDMEHTFDPEHAVQSGIDLAHVLVVRPNHGREALMILQALVAVGQVKAIVLDSMDVFALEPRGVQRFIDTLCRLLSPLAATHCTLISLAGSTDSGWDKQHADAITYLAAVRLHLAQEQWLQTQHNVWRYQAQLSMFKQKRTEAFASMLLTIPAV